MAWTVGPVIPRTWDATLLLAEDAAGMGLDERRHSGPQFGDGAEHLWRPLAPRSVKLLAIGSSAGLFSGLFGVGGGTVIVPLTILWLGYREREATGTALAAVALIAAVGAGVHGAYGSVHVRDAALVGLPAVLGVLAGTALQQHIPQRVLSLAFSVLLVVIAADLVLK